MTTLTLAEMQAYAELDQWANVLDADDLAKAGIDLTPTSTGDCFGPFKKQEAWNNLDTSDFVGEGDETNANDMRPQNKKQTVLDLLWFSFLLLAVGGYAHAWRN